jgi:hypothetical protein
MLFKDSLKSTSSSIYIYWDRIADKEMPTTGYVLQAAILGSQKFETIYDGVDLPQVTSFSHTDIVAGGFYNY